MRITDDIVGHASGFGFVPQRWKCIDELDSKIGAGRPEWPSELTGVPKRNKTVSICEPHQPVKNAMAVRQVHEPRAQAFGARRLGPVGEYLYKLLTFLWRDPRPNRRDPVNSHWALRVHCDQEGIWGDRPKRVFYPPAQDPAQPVVYR